MDSHHSIHTLAAFASGASGGKQHPMHQFHTNTLQHQANQNVGGQHTQPLIHPANQNHQLLQFHHPAGTPPIQTSASHHQQQHPYSTLHHLPSQHHNQHPAPHHQLIAQLQHLNNPQANSHFHHFHHPSSSQNSASSQATLANNHLFSTSHEQQQQQQAAAMLGQPSGSSHSAGSQPNSSNGNNSQQAYNINSSDYSSSTYHVYDQILGDQIIDDLIVIKQERMKKKLEQEQRRKMILMALAVILLVGLLMFVLIQLFRVSSPVSLAYNQQMRGDVGSMNNNNNLLDNEQPPTGAGQYPGLQAPYPAPPGGGRSQVWQYDPTRMPTKQPGLSRHQNPIYPTGGPLQPLTQPNGPRVITTSDQHQIQQQYSKCRLANCNNHGECNESGHCQCHAGFTGFHCELIVQTVPTIPIESPGQDPVNKKSSGQDLCALMLNNCNGKGHCTQQGHCNCLPGFMGDSCQLTDLCLGRACSNQGVCQPETGLCQCRFGFKGAECEQRDESHWQRLLNCSHHGHYEHKLKKCICDTGFSGVDCSEERCEPPASYNRNNSEKHQAGWMDCGQNGLYDCQAKRCACRDGFSGDRCQVQQCSAQCLRNGQCLDGTCICQEGFFGKHCTFNGCPNQCSGRGQCVKVAPNSAQQVSGDASSNQQPEWRCQCPLGSTGDDCGTLIERQCDDGIDNDRDGLVDCADSECCSDTVCQNSTLCMKSPDPLDILMRKQPPPPTSSFFQRMQFLIEKFSSQIYSNSKEFNDSSLASKYVNRASVIRGRVTYQKQGITGVRVSVSGQINLGITLTRDGGHFDLMVNGGGAVVVEFRREPFATMQKTIRVPWNEIVLMDSIELQLDSADAISQTSTGVANSSPLPEPDTPICSAHNYRLLRPMIVAAPQSGQRSHSRNHEKFQQRAAILRDSATVQQAISLPNSSSSANESVSIVYISSRAKEFMSIISLQLTPPASALASNDNNAAKTLSEDLKLIHLKIIIEGNLFEQMFEPQTNLSFVYAWNRRNVYRQKSYGLSTASVSVGYEYFDCKHVIWTTKHIQLPGHDLSISDIGNHWNLNIHHRYNYRDSILQRGDGQNFYLKSERPRVVQPVMGDGYQRQPNCPFCDGATSPVEQKLLRPQALVSASDGSLYVGDFNLIRRIEPVINGASQSERVVRTVLELPTSRVPNKYSLAMNLTDSRLYMSDPERHQVFLVRERDLSALNETGGESDSLISVVGSGSKCQLESGDRFSNCGDGQQARVARLIEPKALAFDLNGRMYIADGPNVRLVDVDQKIYTILGDYGVSRHSKFPCSGEAMPMHKFIPKAPLDLAISPLDETLHILDDNVVYKITQDKRVQVVAGQLPHCLPSSKTTGDFKSSGNQLRATEILLQSARSIAFNQNGDLFISEDDQKSVSRVLLVSPEDDTVTVYAGLPGELAIRSSGEPTEDKLQDQVDSRRATNVLPRNQLMRATEYKFNSISAITLDQQGNLIVADKSQLRVYSIEPDLPQINAAGEYEIQSPDNPDELLLFNRYGHHVATRELSADQTNQRAGPNKYTFSYNVNTSFGQLASVSYANGNKISIYRDGPHHSVKMIETAFGGQCKLDTSRNPSWFCLSSTG